MMTLCWPWPILVNYGKVNFGPLCLWENVETIDLSETIVLYDTKLVDEVN